MTIFGVLYGAVLVIVGVFGYLKSGGERVTALIPAFLGSPVVFLSMLSLNPKYLKLSMHINVVIALLGFLATAKDTVIFISGQEIENELAAYSKSITCIVSLLFIVFSVKSFIKARNEKRASI